MRNAVWKVASVVLLLAAMACANTTSPGGSSTTPTSPPTDLDSARAAWRAEDVGGYALKVQTQCFCAPQDYRVVVGDDGTVQKSASENYLPETVDDLFAIIQMGYDDNAVTVEVIYNAVGVPLRIFIDRSKQMADEEIGFKVAFEELT
jgi:Family of unknown function (DUF6174)